MSNFSMIILPFLLNNIICEAIVLVDRFTVDEIKEAYIRALPEIRKLRQEISVKYPENFPNMTDLKINYTELGPESLKFYFEINKYYKSLHIETNDISIFFTGKFQSSSLLDYPMNNEFKITLNNYILDQDFFITYKQDSTGKYYYDYNFVRGTDYFDLAIEAEDKIKELLLYKDNSRSYYISQIFRGHLPNIYRAIFDEILKELNK